MNKISNITMPSINISFNNREVVKASNDIAVSLGADACGVNLNGQDTKDKKKWETIINFALRVEQVSEYKYLLLQNR